MLLFLAALIISASTPALSSASTPAPCAMDIIFRHRGCRYRVQSLLGSGSFGLVYRCWRTDETTGASSLVALKFKRSGEDTALRAECQILQQHSHESILQVVDWLDADSMQFSNDGSHLKKRGYAIALELASSDLSSLLHNSASTPVHPHLALSWATDVGAALSYLHDKEVTHRDVKPGNILLFWNLQSASPGVHADKGEAGRFWFGTGLAPSRKTPSPEPQAAVHGASTPMACGQLYDEEGLYGVVSRARAARTHRRSGFSRSRFQWLLRP